MGLEDLAREIRREAHVIWDASYIYAASLAVLGFGVLKFIQWVYAVRLANAESTAAMYKERLARIDADQAMAIATAAHSYQATPTTVSPLPPKSASILPSFPPERGSPKVYVHREHSAAYLLGVFEGRTDLQARKMLETEIGKWIVTEGVVGGVSDLSECIMVGLLAAPLRFVFCYFPRNTDGLANINLGDNAQIDGRIKDITSLGITLEECTLIR